MTGKRRYFQYRVTDVEGSMVGRVAVGDLTLDYWHGKRHTYTIYDLAKHRETGSFSVALEGECTREQYDGLAANGKPVDDSRVAA